MITLKDERQIESIKRNRLLKRQEADKVRQARFRHQVEEVLDLAETFANALVGLVAATEVLQYREVTSVDSGVDFYDEVRRFEITLISSALKVGGSQTNAAALLNMKITTLSSKMKQFGLQRRTLTSPVKRISVA
jgi:hypothetical protein